MIIKKIRKFKNEFLFLIDSIKNYRGILISLFFVIIFLSITEATTIGSIMPVVDLILDQSKFLTYLQHFNNFFGIKIDIAHFVKIFFIFLGFLFLLSFCFEVLAIYLSSKIREKLNLELRNRILKNYLFNKKISFFLNSKTGDLIQKLLAHTTNTSLAVWEILCLLKDLIIGLFIYLLLLYLSFVNTIFITIFFLVFIFGTVTFGRKILFQKTFLRNKHQSEIYSLLNIIISAVKVIKIFSKESFFYQKFYDYSQNYKNKEIFLQTVNNLPSAVIKLIIFIFVLSFGYYLLTKNNYNIAEFSYLVIYIGAAYKFLGIFGNVNNRTLALVTYLPSITIVMNEILNLDNDSLKFITSKNIINLSDFNKNFRIENIFYKHESSNKNTLNKVTLDIKKGSLNAIIGPSGSGKSTLVDLMCGFITPTSGSLKIDGEIVENFSKLSFQKLSYCNQDHFIFSGTIIENITFFQKTVEIDYEKLNKVIDICEIGAIINKKGEDNNFNLLEGGSNLSKGEKQRINLARALYYQSKFLILDEPLSNVEKFLEEKIVLKIFSYAKELNSTLVIISHSIKSLAKADQIIIIEVGSLMDAGSHDYLIKKNDFYKKNYI
jgi:ABC-type multidrug transport system fused ATPase/permease subunit